MWSRHCDQLLSAEASSPGVSDGSRAVGSDTAAVELPRGRATPGRVASGADMAVGGMAGGAASETATGGRSAGPTAGAGRSTSSSDAGGEAGAAEVVSAGGEAGAAEVARATADGTRSPEVTANRTGGAAGEAAGVAAGSVAGATAGGGQDSGTSDGAELTGVEPGEVGVPVRRQSGRRRMATRRLISEM